MPSVRSAVSASIVDVEKPVTATASCPKGAPAIRSAGGLAPMKARAAAVASSSACPFIERELSTARTTLFARARFCASKPATAWPFSSSEGGCCDGGGAATRARPPGGVGRGGPGPSQGGRDRDERVEAPPPRRGDRGERQAAPRREHERLEA